MHDANNKKLELFVPESLLSRLMDDRDLMKQVLEACLPDLGRNLERYQAQLAIGDLKEALRTVHSIKGSAQNSDMRALAAVAVEIEDALREGDREYARNREGEFVTVVEDTLHEVKRCFPDLN